MAVSASAVSFTLYEDDGRSLGYRQGEFANTMLTCTTSGKTVTLTIGGRQGRFAGMPATRDFEARVRLHERPRTVMLDSVPATDFNWSERGSTACVKIPAGGAAPRTLKFN